MRALIFAALFAGCGGGGTSIDAGPSCTPLHVHRCIIADPPLPPEFAPWKCTDGAARGRVPCAICEPAQAAFCDAGGVVCVDSCTACQVPGWPACRPDNDVTDAPTDMALETT